MISSPGDLIVGSNQGNYLSLLSSTGTVLANPWLTCPDPRWRTQQIQIDPDGQHFYVAQSGSSQGVKGQIGRFDIATGQLDGFLIQPFNSPGSPNPIAMAFSGNSVFVAGCDSFNSGDRENYGIVKEYNRFTGAYISTVVPPAPPWATGVAVSPVNGHVFVSSYSANMIYEYARSGTSWSTVRSFNGGGAVKRSSGITFDQSGNLYVANGGAANVLQFTPTTAGWALGKTYSGLGQPEAVTIGPDNQLYVADYGAGKVVKFDPANPAIKSTFASGLSTVTGLAFVPGTPLRSGTAPTNTPPVTATHDGQLMIFSGTGFVPLTGQLPNKPTVVLIHGWNRTNEPSLNDPDMWTFGATHGDGETPSIGRLGARTDINVVAWDWLVDAHTNDNTVPDENVVPQGLKLYQAMKTALGGTNTKSVQLIGHSLGAGVATWAADKLKEKSYNIDQVTLFDAAEDIRGVFLGAAPLLLDTPLLRLSLQGTWIDNYYSAAGRQYYYNFGNMVNVDLKTGLDRTGYEVFTRFADDHSYPMWWYFGAKPSLSVSDPNGDIWGNPSGTMNPATGYPVSLATTAGNVGAAWSKVLVGSGTLMRGNWTSDSYTMIDKSDPYALMSNAVTLSNTITITKPDLTGAAASGTAYSIPRNGSNWIFAKTHSPVYVFLDVTLDSNAYGLSFSFDMLSPLPNDVLAVYFGSDLLFSIDGSCVDAGTVFDSGVIDVSEFAGQSGTLTFVFNSASANKVVEFGDLQVLSVPEPATLSLLAMGGMTLIRRRRK